MERVVTELKETTKEAALFCVHCREESPHEIIYLNDRIWKIRCKVCERKLEFRIDIKEEIIHEVLQRLITKPSRLSKDYRQNLSDFIRRFPRRFVSKPYRLYLEAKEVKHFLDEKHDQAKHK